MAVIHFRGNLPPLNNTTRFTMVTPDILPEDGRKWRALWLLGDDGRFSDDMLRRIDAEALSVRINAAVIMPEGLHSDYENMVRGLPWYDYVTTGLPEYIRSIFPVSDRREDNFVFGYGMGGLGAFRIAMRDPRFALAYGCCCADFDVFADDEAHSGPDHVHRMQTIYGDDYRSEEILRNSDPLILAENAADVPRMLICGGSSAAKIAGILSEKSAEITYIPSSGENDLLHALYAFERIVDQW